MTKNKPPGLVQRHNQRRPKAYPNRSEVCQSIQKHFADLSSYEAAASLRLCPNINLNLSFRPFVPFCSVVSIIQARYFALVYYVCYCYFGKKHHLTHRPMQIDWHVSSRIVAEKSSQGSVSFQDVHEFLFDTIQIRRLNHPQAFWSFRHNFAIVGINPVNLGLPRFQVFLNLLFT